MFNNSRQSKEQAGFTLVELMVAMVIFMIVMLGLVRGEIAAISINSQNVFRDEALRLADEELTRLRSLQFSSAGTSPLLAPMAWTAQPAITVAMRKGSATFTRWTRIINITTSVTAMRQIDVAVGYTQGSGGTPHVPSGLNRQVDLSTIIVRD